MKRILPVLVMLFLITGLAGCSPAGLAPFRIAVMLPLSGPDALDKQPLEWALEHINTAGVAGKKLSLVYYDLARKDLAETVRTVAADNSILAVIGPDSSEKFYNVAAEFFAAHKVMISPCATSADVFRAFSQYQTLWRTVESDISQVRVMLTIAAREGAARVALVAPQGYYGNTFSDWFAFFAIELGMEITDTLHYTGSGEACSVAMDTALSHRPDALLAVPADMETSLVMAKRWRTSGSAARLIFSDMANSAYLARNLGQSGDGIEGIELSADVENGFAQAYQKHFRRQPPVYAANLYDALCLAAYGLERSGGEGGMKLAESMAQVADGRGEKTGWDKEGLARALALIRSGNLPDIGGATGPLNFDKQSHTELASSTYEHWRIENGRYSPLEYFNTGDSPTAVNELSIFRTLASDHHRQTIAGQDYQPGVRTGMQALIVAASKGWDNYRHQADALAQYRLLRRNGVPDDDIILIMEDDIAGSFQNPEPGTIRNVSGGENLYSNIQIDYRLDRIDAAKLLDILAGKKTPETPQVIESGPGDNIYVFIVGHGSEEGVYLGVDSDAPAFGTRYSVLRPADLAQTISAMYDKKSYRRMLLVVESCHGGTMGSEINAPGVLLLSGANRYENSLSANYDIQHKIWLADSFAYLLWTNQSQDPGISINNLYQDLYLNINGSHVTAFAPDFGNADEILLREFITP